MGVDTLIGEAMSQSSTQANGSEITPDPHEICVDDVMSKIHETFRKHPDIKECTAIFTRGTRNPVDVTIQPRSVSADEAPTLQAVNKTVEIKRWKLKSRGSAEARKQLAAAIIDMRTHSEHSAFEDYQPRQIATNSPRVGRGSQAVIAQINAPSRRGVGFSENTLARIGDITTPGL